MEQLSAISEITDPEKIRVVLFINNSFVHAPLPALVRQMNEKIEALEEQVSDLQSRIADLESL
jgi:polyhydroxyalkanoate synthesis regulator phasin